MALNSFKDLTVWRKSFLLTTMIYKTIRKLPKDERYGLVTQMTRCAVSIPSNIAEGQQRNNLGEYIQFLGIANGSAAELETQLLLVQDIYGIDITTELNLLYEVQKMLKSMIKKLKPST
jgi:four helix bundle protein